MAELPQHMKAMVFTGPGAPLQLGTLPVLQPGPGQLLVKVLACGVCRTDLHIVDGELAQPKLPLVPGHEIVGRVVKTGPGVDAFETGQRIGIPWLGYTDGTCFYCQNGMENLCDHPQFTGYTLDGGYAEYAVADAHYCFALPEVYPDAQAAPLMCAGLIGYRAYRMAGDAVGRLGLYGFGAAAHILIQIAVHQGRKVYAFTRAGDVASQQFARQLGAEWAGSSEELPPEPLDAAILFAPVGSLVPAALRAVRKGGRVVCAGIHMSDIPTFSYHILWEERQICSVANLTRADGEGLLQLAPQVPVQTEVQTFPLEQANQALTSLRNGVIQGAAVLIP